jgi:hypothetical protein
MQAAWLIELLLLAQVHAIAPPKCTRIARL